MARIVITRPLPPEEIDVLRELHEVVQFDIGPDNVPDMLAARGFTITRMIGP